MAKSILDRQNNLETERRNSIAVEAQCSHDHQDLGFKLPQIQISKFDGAYFRWLEFRDTFENLIHNNDRIKAIHKFHYLISYLEGDAARIISNLEVSSVNYANAWQLLGDRYNNKRLLINHHLSSLFNIQAHTRESERSLRFLVDHVTKNLRALASLGQPTDRWDILIIFMLSSKLDSRTLMKWEEYRNTLDDVPTLDQFHKFLIDRADVLEALNRNKYDNNVKHLPVISRPAPSAPTSSNNSNNNHKRNNTKSFVGINQKTKGSLNSNQVKSFTSVCIICSENHKVFECPIFIKKGIQERLADVTKYKLCANCLRQGHPVSECRFGPCRECKQKHNSLLHESKQSVVNNSVVVSSVSSAANVSNLGSNQVLLSTAVIEVVNPSTNEKEKVRALLDCGSESSFITKSLKERLSLKSYPSDCLKVIGIGNNHNNNITESCIAQINSLNDSFKVKLSCFVLKELTSNIPKCVIDIKNLNIPKNLPLADPEFNHPASIEVLIGADIFWDLLGSEHHSLGPKNPHLRNSRLGWLISGPINVPNKPFLTPKEQECEKHFMTHTVRLSNGRFEVKLPLTESPDCLGDSYNLAKKRFLNLERKFKRNPALKSKYSEFIREYAELGHLSESAILKPTPGYFLCHHAVFKNSESTALRVVFDGSAASSTGVSLNDILMTGPNVQDSLFSILVRARQYRFILSGDIEKMYRQVQVNTEDRDLQLVIWRGDESEPLRTLRLNTLTYGTASASYLSTRCLSQLGEEQHDPLIKTIIQKDFYVDDLITGSNDENELRYIQRSVAEALRLGCFNLRKYKSNLPTLFVDSSINIHEHLTISLISPCIVKAKILLQKSWKEKLDWDEPVPDIIKEEWNSFADNLPFIQGLNITRPVICDSPTSIEMHVFSDASQVAYGSCVYMRSVAANGDVTVKLLCSKSKISPVKPTTIVRLELCAALLAARLSRAVLDSLRYKPDRVLYWSDSSIVLAWLKNNITQLKSFVANRITEILEITYPSTWRQGTSVAYKWKATRSAHGRKLHALPTR
ncbi:uncharacterized protein LOC123657149 [Melitaea cinxia]|uniref:uncharacterized protein LOC123657149 n=1 Tax=Melitaea cinxia TaxID=113334 RepID=UPI001E274907|nr:uncharacterized protein LOC123657149 [Melitaea cinxia]